MTSWIETGRPALFAALTKVCDQITQDLEDDFDQRDARIAQEYEKRVKAEAIASGLRAEITRLRTELDSTKAQQAATTPSHPHQQQQQQQQHNLADPADATHPASSALGPSSSPTDKDWKTEYFKSKAKFQALDVNFKKAKELLAKRTDERKSWTSHAEWLEKKILAAEEKHNIHILDKADRITRDGQQKEKQSERSDTLGEQNDAEKNARARDKPTAETEIGAPMLVYHPQPVEDGSHSLNETENQLPALPSDDGKQAITAKQEPSSDGPVVLYERPVKRRRHNGVVPETPATKTIKTEPHEQGSSPLVSTYRCGFFPQESIDLGAEAGHMVTPRKRKASGERLPSVSEGPAHHSSDEASEAIAPPEETPAAVSTPTTNPIQPSSRISSALTPIDANARIIKPNAPRSRSKNRGKALVQGIGDLAEDGFAYKKPTSRKAPLTPAAAAKGRLGSMLNTPVSEDAASIVGSSRRSRQGLTHPHEELPLPKQRDLPFDKSLRESARGAPHDHGYSASRSPLFTEKTNPTPKTVHSSSTNNKKPRSLLRNKPISELKLDDFKINPKANEGHDFAFSEVVRDKAERACLPGCVDMHCCGKEFRALAQSQKPIPPLTAAQRQEEEKLLIDYLGDYCYRLPGLDKEERDKLWLEAKTQELANKYGKHRHRFSRMRSPPGFWNADFPSTQELEAERVEAGKRERKMVQERHREAMRSGGRWIFRDE